MTDFLDRLDAAIGCQQCGGPLTDTVSDYFCGENCAELWSDRQSRREAGDNYHLDYVDIHDWSTEARLDLAPVSWPGPCAAGPAEA